MLLAPQPVPDTTVVPITDSAVPVHPPQHEIWLTSVARAATLGVQVYPSVASAQFTITGEPEDLHLTASLTFLPGPENQRIKDEIHTELIPGLETILGASFTRTTLNYSVADPMLTAAPDTAA